MRLGKKKIREDTAVATYIDFLASAIKRDWDEIHQNFKDLVKEIGLADDAIIRDERRAVDAFCGANIALAMQAVKNLFPLEQAERLKSLIIDVLDDENRIEVIKYNDIYERAVKDLEDPVSVISGIVLSCWLGEDMMKLKELGLGLQFLVMYIDELFVGYSKYWKTIKEKYKLIESGSSLEQ